MVFYHDQLGYLFLFCFFNLIIVGVLCSLIDNFRRNRAVIIFLLKSISDSRRCIIFSALANWSHCSFLVVFKICSIMPYFSSLNNDS